MLKPGLNLRSTYLAQFLLILHRKALTLLKYIEDETWVTSHYGSRCNWFWYDFCHSTPAHHVVQRLITVWIPHPQAKGKEAFPLLAQLEDRPRPDGGRRPEYHHGVGWKAEGWTALLCIWEAILHQCTGARCAHELLTLTLIMTYFYHLLRNGKEIDMTCPKAAFTRWHVLSTKECWSVKM